MKTSKMPPDELNRIIADLFGLVSPRDRVRVLDDLMETWCPYCGRPYELFYGCRGRRACGGCKESRAAKTKR